jgi:predicted HD phosphohydrolase
MYKKGFLRDVSRYKIFDDVLIEAGKKTSLLYEWDSKTPFGK